jgi:glycosyltransferase involved in cell wall biosynthesis
VAGTAACWAIEPYLSGWLERMSRSGIILLTETSVKQFDPHARRVLNTLSIDFPSFEFGHDGGLAIVAIGEHIPRPLVQLTNSSREPHLAGQIRSWYERLGQGVQDQQARIVLERLAGDLQAQVGMTQIAREGHGSLREQNVVLLEEHWLAEEKRRELLTELAEVQKTNRDLRERLTQIGQGHTRLEQELKGLYQSRGWAVLQQIRRVRTFLGRDEHISEKSKRILTRLAKLMMRKGSRGAGKISAKLRRSLRIGGATLPSVPYFPLAHLSEPVAGGRRFEDLGWVFTGKRADRRPGQVAYSKILLISHSACRTGAPRCLLRLARELALSPQFECWIVLQRGGELFEDFARAAPTVDAGRLVQGGINAEDLPDLIAALFRGYTSRGIAVCNTMAVSKFHAALSERQIPVLSWVHELPTMVDLFGGTVAIEHVKAASRQIVVPVEIVREAWIRRFQIEPAKIRVLRYGVEPRTDSLDRGKMRARVRREFGIPEDGFIVLGCGTVDLRKGADLFAQVARRLFTRAAHREVANRTWFLWVGDSPFPFLRQWLAHDGFVEGFDGRLIFCGEREDTAPFFAASDVFVLTSREDPCPFANLEAMESGLPVVVFQDAGGAPEVIGAAGTTVPYLDLDAMTDAVLALLENDLRRAEMGRAGKDIVRRDFTWPGLMNRFRNVLLESYEVFPPLPLRVSVIVPNYRHAPYLEERLQSIYQQTIRPHEIIVLDDASPDESKAVIERLMPGSPVPIRLIPNETNSGSPFRQWIKGLELASGDLIWLAESDDSCHPEFLERLIPEFYDSKVALAYCQSELIGPDGSRLEGHFLDHTNDLSRSRWRARYCVPGAVEVELALSQKNTIPNASAMLFRQPGHLDFLDGLFALKFAGDWLFHAMLCREGKVAYIPDVLNRYRRHEQTVSHRAVRGETYLSETLRVKRQVFDTFKVSVQAMTRSLAQTVFEYYRLNPDAESGAVSNAGHGSVQADLAKIRALFQERFGSRSSLKILLVLEDLSDGLLSLSSVHLANALAREHIVFVCNARPQVCDPEVVGCLDPRVLFLEGSLGFPEWPLARQHEQGWEGSELRIRILEELIQLHGIDLVDSRSSEADKLIGRLSPGLDLPRFTLQQVNNGADSAGSDSIVDDLDGDSADRKSTLIPTRQEPGLDPEFLSRTSERRGRHEHEFVIWMAASGSARDSISSVASTAVRVVNRLPESERAGKRIRLLLGEPSQALERVLQLVSRLGSGEPSSSFRMPLETLLQSDALLLSEPRTRLERCILIASLGMGIPLIAAGEHLRDMLCAGSHEAGQLLPLSATNRLALDDFVAAILRYVQEPLFYRAHQAAAEAVFRKRYAIDRVAQQCSIAYQKACSPFPRVHDGVTSPERRSA